MLIDLDALRFGPIHDPIRALVYCGTGELVDTVIVAGRKLMENKRLIAWDEACILAEMRKGVERVWSSCSNWHWSGQEIDEAFPALPFALGGKARLAPSARTASCRLSREAGQGTRADEPDRY